MLDRQLAERSGEPTAGVIDSQSVEAPHAPERGYDSGKKIVGCKRHIAVDSDGRLLLVRMTAADVADSSSAICVLDALKLKWPSVKHLFGDSVYDRVKLMDKAKTLDMVVEVVRRHQDQQGFEVLLRRWVVERTFGWMTRWRRLVRDYERNAEFSEAMAHIAMSTLIMRRWTFD